MCKLNHIGSKGIKDGVADQFTCQVNAKQFALLEPLGQQLFEGVLSNAQRSARCRGVVKDEEKHT